MNNNLYPNSNKQWEEKVKKKRLMKNLSEDNKNEFETLTKAFEYLTVLSIDDCFNLENILFDNKLKEIIFDLKMTNNDHIIKLPFIFKLSRNSYCLKEEWIDESCEKNLDFLNLVKNYVKFFYLIKTIDLNMDYIKNKIKEIYPDFNKIICDYKYNYISNHHQ